ncbi:MAG: glucose-6-phosphate dehydrogenase [Bacteroidales bacterium]|nr:glucose-6-phosphate dehydrogenase [Bacteroidales bacterium]
MQIRENQLLVIFGASGDLTSRKLIPALFALHSQKLLPGAFAVIGTGRSDLSDEAFRQLAREVLKISDDKKTTGDPAVDFIHLLHYVSIDTLQPSAYKKLKEKMEDVDQKFGIGGNCIFYLATPPDLYTIIAESLAIQHLNKSSSSGWRRLIIEKPVGYNYQSARSLHKSLYAYFNEEQLYRIDHYLGKETVQNVMVTRFSNGIFEPLWNRNYVHHVEITSSESIGIENRGGYYDKAGAMRDMLQNHLLQLLTLVAMEPPTLITSNAIRNETLKVLQSVRPIPAKEVAENVIRGQYTESTIHGIRMPSYRNEPGIKPDSRTETFVALKLFIENWRWGGVPFFIRTGKRLPTRVTEIVIHFKSTPHKLFCFDENRHNAENQLVIRIQPDEGMLLKFGMKVPGAGFKVQDVNMNFHYSDLAYNHIPEAYQRLLIDCMQGDSTLFTRGDAIEQAWEIVDPILWAWENDRDIPIYGYPAGTWGPRESDRLIGEPNMTWRYPCKNLSDDGIYCEL